MKKENWILALQPRLHISNWFQLHFKISFHENKKALSEFYHKYILDRKWM